MINILCAKLSLFHYSYSQTPYGTNRNLQEKRGVFRRTSTEIVLDLFFFYQKILFRFNENELKEEN